MSHSQSLVPSGCTLPTAAQPLRLAEFDALFASALRAVERPAPQQVRLTLAGAVGVADTVRELVSREAACCSFFEFEVSVDGEVVMLDVRVPPERVGVLEALAARASEVSARGTP